MNVIDKLKEVSAFLESKGIEDAAKEAELLITETLHIDKSKLYTDVLEIPEEVSKHIDSLVMRRTLGEPIQYIIGYIDFYGLKINIGKGVLVPRPETELLVEHTIKILQSRITRHASHITVLDLCTGSGCIALAIAKHLPEALIYGTDKSEVAIDYAKKNASENNIKNVSFIAGNLFEPVANIKLDCIVSNPPYIKRSEIQNLQVEIKNFESLEALDGGEDGLDFYRKIFDEAPDYLKEGGMVIFEIGFDQSEEVKKLAAVAGFRDISFIKDYAGIKRIFIGQYGDHPVV